MSTVPASGRFFAHSFGERSAMAVRLQFAAKKAPNLTDQHVGKRGRVRRLTLAMSQGKLAAALGLTLPAGAEIRERRPTHRSEPVAANVPYPAGASGVLLRGRAERTSTTRLQRKRVIDGPD